MTGMNQLLGYSLAFLYRPANTSMAMGARGIMAIPLT